MEKPVVRFLTCCSCGLMRAHKEQNACDSCGGQLFSQGNEPFVGYVDPMAVMIEHNEPDNDDGFTHITQRSETLKKWIATDPDARNIVLEMLFQAAGDAETEEMKDTISVAYCLLIEMAGLPE